MISQRAMIKLFQPYVSPLARKMVQRVLSGIWLAEGPVVKDFEKEFAKKFNLKNVVAVNSGTSALELAYELAGIGPGDEVIAPVLTCVITNIPLVRRGAKIIFSDIDYDLNPNITDIKIKTTPKTKAIIFVHFGGNNRGLKELLAFCRRRNIILIEDSAQAVGSDFWGKADFSIISLQATKTITSGDGGFLICKNKKDCEKAKRLRWFGYDRDKKQKLAGAGLIDIDLKEAGYKYQMSDVTASIGIGNLLSIDPIIAHNKRLQRIYHSYGFESHGYITIGFTDDYKKLKVAYAKEGIEIGRSIFRNDAYTLFKGFKSKCPIMDELENKYFFVPCHHGIPEKTAHKIGKIYAKYNLSLNLKYA